MRWGLLFLLLTLTFIALLPAPQAEEITIGFTESVVDTGGGDPALAYCTIYKCRGATCTDWQRVKQVHRSAVNGGGVRSESVNVPVAADQLPVSWRFAYSCTTVTGNEGPKLIPNTAAGNPYTVEP